MARSLTLAEISERPRASASCTIGTMRPPGVCTATLTSMLWYCRMKSVFQEAFTSGTFLSACAVIAAQVSHRMLPGVSNYVFIRTASDAHDSCHSFQALQMQN